METKEVKISVPEGYEIDKENSTFDCIKFKPIKKFLTYDDCLRKLKKRGKPIRIEANLIYTSYKQNCKLEAINKLMNVAKYLNGDWKPNWNEVKQKWSFEISKTGKIHTSWTLYYNYSVVYFKSEELAKQALEILGEETVKLALSTDW